MTSLLGGLAEMSAFLKEQQAMMHEQHMVTLERDAHLRSEAREEKAELEAKIALQEAKIERMRDEMVPPAVSLISAKQLEALQSRLEVLHGAQLLADDEMFALEVRIVAALRQRVCDVQVLLGLTVRSVAQDLCADIIELESAAGMLTTGMAQASDTVAKACKVIALSESVGSDAAFARQLKRKFV